jgi:hypothetical protein
MAKDKDKDAELNIFEGDVCKDCKDPADDILKDFIDSISVSDPYPVLDVNEEFMSEMAQKEEEKAWEKMQKSVLAPASPPSPSQIIKNNIIGGGGVKINVKPGNNPLAKTIANPVENDNLVAVIRDNKPTSTIIKTIMEEIAEEAAYLKAWRNENWNTGEDISETTFKRIKMLKHLVETIVEQEKLKKESATGKVDFHGEAFQRVLKYFLETIQKTFRKVHIPIQFEDIFFTELAKEFDNFEKNAERIYYGKD